MQLGSHRDGREVVTARQLGMPQDKSRAQAEGNQQNQGDRRQTLVGDEFPLSGRVGAFGAVATGVEEALLEGPVFGQIHPAVVLVLPAVVAEAADDRSGEGLGGQRGDPEPLVIGLLPGQFSPPIAVALQHLFGADHPHRRRVVEGQGQGFGIPSIPKLDVVGLGIALLRPAEVRGAMREQTYRRLRPIAAVLFEADNRLPASPLQEIKDGALCVKGVQQEDVKEATALEVGQPRQQAQRRRLFAFAGPEPLHAQKRFDRAVNHLTTDGAMIVLNLFHPAASLVLADHPALQATLTAAAETGQHLDPVQGGHQMPLYPSPSKALLRFSRRFRSTRMPSRGSRSKPHKL